VAFVFGDPGTSGFTGGDLLAFRIANHLLHRCSVTFIRLFDWHRVLRDMGGVPLPPRLKGAPPLHRAFQFASTIEPGRWLLDKLGAIPEIDSSARPDPRIRTMLVRRAQAIDCEFDSAIATGWQAAHYLSWGVRASRKYFLIQNAEDEPAYSGGFSAAARAAYDLDLHKIALGEALASRYRNRPSQIAVIYPGIDTQLYNWRTERTNSSGTSIIMPLRAATYKGTDLGLEALRIVSRTTVGVKTVLFGSKWALRAARFKLDHSFVILNNPTNAALSEAFNSNGIFLFPSRVEGFPVTPLEAMRCGCLVVATPTQGARQFLINGETGLLSDRIDATSLAQRLLEGITRYADYGTVIRNGYRLASQFSWDSTFRAFDALLDVGEQLD
jgi:glycosyltransferase involved in cell wall biosynthesis